jgi:hypothetical protein
VEVNKGEQPQGRAGEKHQVLSLFLSCHERILLLEKARQEAFATRVNTGCDCASGELPMTTAGQKSGRVFYGWWIVLASGVGLAMCYGPIIVPTFGVFLKPLSQEFWSRGGSGLALPHLETISRITVQLMQNSKTWFLFPCSFISDSLLPLSVTRLAVE